MTTPVAQPRITPSDERAKRIPPPRATSRAGRNLQKGEEDTGGATRRVVFSAKSAARGPNGRLRAIGNADFAKQILNVLFDRLGADV